VEIGWARAETVIDTGRALLTGGGLGEAGSVGGETLAEWWLHKCATIIDAAEMVV
jgi:hypothetical protein